jgi:hypothetical protein
MRPTSTTRCSLRRRGLRLRLGLEGRHGKGHGIAAIKALLDKLTLKGSLRGKYGCPVKSAGLIYRKQQTRYNSPVFPSRHFRRGIFSVRWAFRPFFICGYGFKRTA